MIAKEIEFALQAHERQAQSNRDDAGYGGRMDDGGYRQMKAEAQAYRDGAAGIFPSFLEPYRKAAQAQIKINEHRQDPEYAEFKRLSEKFKVD